MLNGKIKKGYDDLKKALYNTMRVAFMLCRVEQKINNKTAKSNLVI